MINKDLGHSLVKMIIALLEFLKLQTTVVTIGFDLDAFWKRRMFWKIASIWELHLETTV